MKTAKRTLILVALPIALSLCYFVTWLFCWRYPTVYEITYHMAGELPGKQFVITSDQGDIGLFAVEVEGEDDFYIETIPQWVFPWERYDWSPTAH